MPKSREQLAREARERVALNKAKRLGEPVVYLDDDGCEVTAMPSGHSFYNAADWW